MLLACDGPGAARRVDFREQKDLPPLVQRARHVVGRASFPDCGVKQGERVRVLYDSVRLRDHGERHVRPIFPDQRLVAGDAHAVARRLVQPGEERLGDDLPVQAGDADHLLAGDIRGELGPQAMPRNLT